MALLKFKRSATPSKVPTTSDLALGELALNTYDGKVYMKKDDGTEAVVEVGGSSSSGTVTSVAASAGTGISVSGSPITTSGTLTITNTAPDQTVTLTQAGTTTITGTYPNFTISSADQYDGTVTSVGGTGSVNGLTLSGTVTSSGNITLGGTLAINNSDWSGTDLSVANGGTGASTAAGALANLGAQAAATALTTSTTFGGDVSGTYNAIVVADDSHNHIISNVDGLQTALDEKVDLSGDTMSGDLIISKADARLKLYDSTGTSGNNPYVEWETTANQGIAMEFNPYDGELPVGGYGLVVRESTTNSQFPTTGTLTFNVLGEMYAGGTSLGSLNKVFHDGYHPNADKWTTSRSLSLTNDVTGSVSWDGSGNASLSSTLSATLTPLRATELSSSVDLNNLVGSSAGFYYQTANADTTGNNYPSGEAGSLIVQKSAGNATQFYQTYNSGSPKLFFRSNYNTGYGAWRRVFADDYHPNADTLTTARTISLTGDVSGSTSFNGSANVSITATVADDSHNHIYDNIDGLTTNGWGGPRVTTASGYIDFGPANTSHAHIYTDRPSFYFNVDASANITYGRASVRAPIFYDSNNTAYYVHGDSTSNLHALTLASNLSLNNGNIFGPQYINMRYGSTTAGGLRLYDSEGTRNGTWYGNGAGEHGFLDNDGHWAVRVRTGTSPLTLFCNNNPELYVYNSYVLAAGSMRSPIFYDSANTAYYLDPAATGTSLNVAGSIVAAGNVTAYSDIRVKDNVEQIEGALDKVQAIRGVTYNRTDLEDTERRYGGVIAQEIEEVLPEAIFENGDRKAVDYNATIGLLIEAIKELKAEVDTLRAEANTSKG